MSHIKKVNELVKLFLSFAYGMKFNRGALVSVSMPRVTPAVIENGEIVELYDAQPRNKQGFSAYFLREDKNHNKKKARRKLAKKSRKANR